jgi:hypothetical protein
MDNTSFLCHNGQDLMHKYKETRYSGMTIQENHATVLQICVKLPQLVKVNKPKYKTCKLEYTARKHGHKAV